MKKLRPIGTEFEVIRPPMYDSTDPHGYRIKYRIVDHRRISPTGELTETIECIENTPVDSGWGDQNG